MSPKYSADAGVCALRPPQPPKPSASADTASAATIRRAFCARFLSGAFTRRSIASRRHVEFLRSSLHGHHLGRVARAGGRRRRRRRSRGASARHGTRAEGPRPPPPGPVVDHHAAQRGRHRRPALGRVRGADDRHADRAPGVEPGRQEQGLRHAQGRLPPRPRRLHLRPEVRAPGPSRPAAPRAARRSAVAAARSPSSWRPGGFDRRRHRAGGRRDRRKARLGGRRVERDPLPGPGGRLADDCAHRGRPCRARLGRGRGRGGRPRLPGRVGRSHDGEARRRDRAGADVDSSFEGVEIGDGFAATKLKATSRTTRWVPRVSARTARAASWAASRPAPTSWRAWRSSRRARSASRKRPSTRRARP